MNARACLANTIWAGASLPAWWRFRRALRDPARVQRQILTRLLRENSDTVVGRAHGFSRLLTASDPVAAYQQAVPTTTYDDLEPLIGRLACGEPAVLTRSSIERLAPSSGSTSAAKLLPQTRALQREFSHAVDAWIADLFLRRPGLAAGPAYWSITPSISFDTVAAARLGALASRASVPVGFDDDSAYLGGMRQRLVSAILAAPADLRRVVDPEAFRYVTQLFLARAAELRLISVWHPSYLLQLVETLPENLGRIADDIARGTLTPPRRIPADVHAALAGRLVADPRRARALRSLNATAAGRIWPALTLVSCWGDGAAASYAERLGAAMPGVEMQLKGLIATEAIVSIPFGGLRPLAVRSHFLELMDPSGYPRLVHELASGVEYTVVVTTGGGLYRYRLGDRVRVNGWLDATPSIEFMGRSDGVSDRFGEKLSDGFVAGVLAELFAGRPAPRFAMLAPEVTDGGVAYTLLVDAAGSLPGALARKLESALRRNPHYAWCVDLGQLKPARVVSVGPHADRAYLAACVRRGQRLGDVKPVALHKDSGWAHALGAGSVERSDDLRLAGVQYIEGSTPRHPAVQEPIS
jgi:GH3 auxin-responsive promoter